MEQHFHVSYNTCNAFKNWLFFNKILTPLRQLVVNMGLYGHIIHLTEFEPHRRGHGYLQKFSYLFQIGETIHLLLVFCCQLKLTINHLILLPRIS